jgi:hypothetical protein
MSRLSFARWPKRPKRRTGDQTPRRTSLRRPRTAFALWSLHWPSVSTPLPDKTSNSSPRLLRWIGCSAPKLTRMRCKHPRMRLPTVSLASWGATLRVKCLGSTSNRFLSPSDEGSYGSTGAHSKRSLRTWTCLLRRRLSSSCKTPRSLSPILLRKKLPSLCLETLAR